MNQDPKMSRRRSNNYRGTVLAAIVAALLGFGLVAYLIYERNSTGQQTGGAAATTTAANQPAQKTQGTGGRSDSVTDILGMNGDGGIASPHDWKMTVLGVTVRLALAAFLSAILAFRPRKFTILFKRNPFVSQTQILMAVVASALMMVVGDSAARAFGIFAAASLVRFRTNIRDPKEITVLLACLSIGLATGVGRWELAVILSLFVLLLLWMLEYNEPQQVTRPMELRVQTRNVDETEAVLRRLFRHYNFSAEVRAINREDEKEPLGSIVYYVDVSPLISTDRISDEILDADDENIDSIEWNQQKNANIFQ